MSESVCVYCGMIHKGVCPMIKEIEYWPDGSTKKVVFKNDKQAKEVER